MDSNNPSPSVSAKAEGSPKAKQAKTRSRNGCLVCRARRIRCDEGKPDCQRCIKYSAECVYPVKKAFDSEAITKSLSKRHKTNAGSGPSAADQSAADTITALTNLSSSFAPPFPAGNNDLNLRLGVASTSNVRGEGAAGPSHHGGVKLYDDAPTSMDALMALCRMTKMGTFFSGGEMPPDYLQESFQDPDELRCLHHCLAYTLSIIVVKEDYNPWVEQIAPMFLYPTAVAPISSEALRYAMAATGATHLAYLRNRIETERDSHDRSLSVQYRSRAMSLLRQARRDSRELVSDAFFAAASCIGHNDVLSAEVCWREAAGYCRDAVAARGGCADMLFGADGKGTPGEVEKVLIEHLAFGDLTKSLSTGYPPVVLDSASDWWERLGQVNQGRPNIPTVELTKGLHRGMVRLTARAAALIANKRTLKQHGLLNRIAPFTPAPSFLGNTPDIALDSFNQGIADLERDLVNWRAPQDVGDQRTRIGSTAFWHMCHILLRWGLQDQTMEVADVQSSVRAILELCAEAGDKIEYLNWPLLVASCVMRDPVARDQSRAVIKTFAYQCCNEIKVLHEVVEEVWRRMDDGWDEESCGWVEVMLELGRGVMMG